MNKETHPVPVPKGAAIAFYPKPPLWPEMYTDCFALNRLADKEECEDVALEVIADTAGNFFTYDSERRLLFTSDQVVVELFREKLYGYEIAFSHVHIPNPTNDE